MGSNIYNRQGFEESYDSFVSYQYLFVWNLAFHIPVISGVLVDLLSATKYLQIMFVVVAGVLVVFAMLLHKSMGVIVGMIITLSISACLYSMRAIFFAPMDEVNVPSVLSHSHFA